MALAATPAQDKTFQIRPTLEDSFKAAKVKEIINRILQNLLTDKTYSGADAAKWTKEISDSINSEITELKMSRYKHIVQVIVGQQTGAGCKYTTRCLWDAESDSHVSEQFVNGNLFCIVTVFGIYLY